MKTFQSNTFLGFAALFIIIFLLDLFYRQYVTHYMEKSIYGRHYALKFHLKQMVARLLLKLSRRETISDDVVDKLQILSDKDPMVRFLIKWFIINWKQFFFVTLPAKVDFIRF